MIFDQSVFHEGVKRAVVVPDNVLKGAKLFEAYTAIPTQTVPLTVFQAMLAMMHGEVATAADSAILLLCLERINYAKEDVGIRQLKETIKQIQQLGHESLSQTYLKPFLPLFTGIRGGPKWQTVRKAAWAQMALRAASSESEVFI